MKQALQKKLDDLETDYYSFVKGYNTVYLEGEFTGEQLEIIMELSKIYEKEII